MNVFEYIVIVACVIIAIVALSRRNIASRSMLEKMYDEYTFLVDSCNDIIFSTRDVSKRMTEKRFKNENDEINAHLLIEHNINLINLLKNLFDVIVENIKKKDMQKHRVLIKKAQNYLDEAMSNCNALSDVYNEMITEEEFEIREREAEERRMAQVSQTREENASVFFAGCNEREQVEKRYKALAKVFHPDMSTGNEETFKLIKQEYERRIRF